MSTTTYYEFNKPEGTDLVNPLVDTNPNWDALDADLHEFNERSIANCTEIVTLGVHAISRLDTTAKFLKWIATANFTAGETFTVDGLSVAASTPAGATLATGAYVTGSVVLACLNADNTAITVFVSGTTVASDAERLGGQLPAYYATQSDMTTAESNITNLQNKMGNTSIVGIGDGTATGAISAINADLTDVQKITNNLISSDVTTASSVDIGEDIDSYRFIMVSTLGGGGAYQSVIIPTKLFDTTTPWQCYADSNASRTITLQRGANEHTISISAIVNCTLKGIYLMN